MYHTLSYPLVSPSYVVSSWIERFLSYPLVSPSYVVSSWIERFAGSGGLVPWRRTNVWESGLRYRRIRDLRPSTTIFYRVVSEPPYFSRGLSSSKGNHHFKNGGWLPGVWYVFLSIEIITPICTNEPSNFNRWRYQFLRTGSLFFSAPKNAVAGSHWQAEVNLANTDLKHFLQQIGLFAALDYPPRNADHDAVALRGSPCRCTMSCHWFGLIWSLEDRARRSYGTHVGQAVSSSHEHCKVAYLSGHPAKYLSLEVLRCWKPCALSDDAASGSHTASAAARAILGWALGDAVQRNQLQKTICEPERLPLWIAQPLCDDAALCVMLKLLRTEEIDAVAPKVAP